MIIVSTILILYLSSGAEAQKPKCVIPLLECPNKNITFWIYRGDMSNRSDPAELRAMDDDSIAGGSWIAGAPIKMFIHGYTGHKDFSPNTELRPAFMEVYHYNLISVDYGPLALEGCYIQAAINIQVIAKCTAQLIDVLVKRHGILLRQFHIIGFSLGAHVAGAIPNYLTVGTLDRITGLDPALPLFALVDKRSKLDKDDAKFVDVLHTNAMQKGKLERCGTVDFYANGGLTQPGCEATDNQSKSGCDHARAPAYFAESINTRIGFYATQCMSWFAYIIGLCNLIPDKKVTYFGENVPWNVNGSYFFDTNSEPPYAKGKDDNYKQAKRSMESNVKSELMGFGEDIPKYIAENIMEFSGNPERFETWLESVKGKELVDD